MPTATLLILTVLAATMPAPPTTPPPAPPAKLEFPLAGFRINLLEPFKESSSFSMSLPVSGDGTASVSVDRQPTMKERPSFQNFQDAKTLRAHNGDPILMERAPSSGEWRMEYTSTKAEMGSQPGSQPVPKKHIYQRVCSANGITYVISATALDSEWPVLGPKLKACADSFELSSAPDPGKVAIPSQGFRINKLDRAVPMDEKQELLSMGFVSVRIEPYAKTLKDYQAEHKTRVTIPNGKIKILAENTPAENTLVTEYVEEAPAGGIHPNVVRQAFVCEKVVLAHGQLYLAVGIHFDWDKEDVSYAQMKACVESLEAVPAPVK